MTTIEKIRTEVERRIKQTHCHEFVDEMREGPNGNDGLLSFLDTLEAQDPEVDFEQELYNRFGQVKDFTLGMRIAQYFYNLGKNAK